MIYGDFTYGAFLEVMWQGVLLRRVQLGTLRPARNEDLWAFVRNRFVMFTKEGV